MRLFRAAALVVGCLAIGAAQTQPFSPRRETITKHFTPADRESGRYQYVPFDVPPGTRLLTVNYSYDRAGGENVVDLGVFEPGPLGLHTPAFRGYSGGARAGFSIGLGAATPGYRPGPIPHGRWHVLLGLYRVRAEGVSVTLTIDTADNVVGSISSSIPDPPSPPPPRRGWYTGALHMHTVHSDGSATPLALMQGARQAGFDFVAITDHNNTTHSTELAPAWPRSTHPLWIIGEEVTTPGGHASVWGLTPGDWIDFRVKAGDPQIAAIVARARALGGLFSINHPASTCLGCGWEHAVVEGIEAIEISNGRHGEVQNALATWDTLLRSGRRITGIGSSDWHGVPTPMDVAHVRVDATALTQDAVLAAIRRGRVIVMNGMAHATPEIAVHAGGRTAGIGESLAAAEGTLAVADVRAPGLALGRLLVIANGNAPLAVPLDDRGVARHQWPVQHGYVRFELVAADTSPVAYTNPIFIVRP